MKEKPNVVMLDKTSFDGFYKNKTVNESAVESPAAEWYRNTFKDKWRSDAPALFREAGVIKHTDEETELFINSVKEYMRQFSGMFEFVGAGTERIAFGFRQYPLCLKLCAPYDGYYENQTQGEVRTYSMFKGAKCIYRMLDWDELGFSSSLCECCKQADPDMWRETFGISYKATCEICRQMVAHKTTKLPAQLVRTIKAMTFSNPGFIDGLLAESEPKYEALMSWVKIGIQTNGQKLRDAFDHIENWGLTYENGDPVMKIIDAGL